VTRRILDALVASALFSKKVQFFGAFLFTLLADRSRIDVSSNKQTACTTEDKMDYECTVIAKVAGWTEKVEVEFEVECGEPATGLPDYVELIKVVDENGDDVLDKMSADERWILEGKCLDQLKEDFAV
jgi:hypothetical protein